jgi:hypothetical protein
MDVSFPISCAINKVRCRHFRLDQFRTGKPAPHSRHPLAAGAIIEVNLILGHEFLLPRVAKRRTIVADGSQFAILPKWQISLIASAGQGSHNLSLTFQHA